MKFVGCRRSGNHAIIEWVLKHYGTATLHNDLPSFWNGETRPSQTIEYSNADRGGSVIAHSWEDKKVVDQCVIIRSAYNVAASRLSSPSHLLNTTRRIDRFLDVWPNHAKSITKGDWPAILYDHWIQDPSIWAGIMNLPQPHLPLPDWQPKRGKQTTFKVRDTDARLTRYLEVELPPEVLEHDEIRDLNHELFGWTLNRSGEYLS